MPIEKNKNADWLSIREWAWLTNLIKVNRWNSRPTKNNLLMFPRFPRSRSQVKEKQLNEKGVWLTDLINVKKGFASKQIN